MKARDVRDAVRAVLGRLSRANLLIAFSVLALSSVGIAFIYGAGQQSGGAFATYWQRQLLWIGVGGVCMLVMMLVDYDWMRHWWWGVYAGSILLLLLVLLVGLKINGARSWIKLPGMSIQPSEFAKVGLIVALSWWASRPDVDLKRPTHALVLVGLTGLPVVLIGLQPDYGSALTLLPIALALLFLGGMPKRWILYVAIAGLAAAPLVYTYVFSDHQCKRIQTFTAPYVKSVSEERRATLGEFIDGRTTLFSEKQRKRLKGLLNPKVDLQNAGWNAHQSLLAVGSGGLMGKGFGQGTQNPLGFLPRPVSTTDFIFSVIAEETGFVGSSLILGLFLLLVSTGIYIGTKARDPFGRYLAFAISVLLSVHIYVNVGMTMGMAPIIGIPLPFVSYGGSFMLAMLIAMGILQSVYVHRHKSPNHHPAEHLTPP